MRRFISAQASSIRVQPATVDGVAIEVRASVEGEDADIILLATCDIAYAKQRVQGWCRAERAVVTSLSTPMLLRNMESGRSLTQ